MQKRLIALLLMVAASPATAQTVMCDGTESGGSGPRRYAYTVTDPNGTMTDLYIGTEDIVATSYTARLMPTGWAFEVVANPAAAPFVNPALADDSLKTPHGLINVTGPAGVCGYMVHFSGPAGLPGGTFTFGFDHPWTSHDVEWQTIDGVGATRAVWGAVVGGGIGPLHGPDCAYKFPNGNPPDIMNTEAAFKVTFVGDPSGTAPCTLNLNEPDNTVIGRSDPFMLGDPANWCDAAPIVGGGLPPYPDTAAIGEEPCSVPEGFPLDVPTRWEVHTEILSLSLEGMGCSVKAGQPYFDSVLSSGAPIAPNLMNNHSFGEVASLYEGNPLNRCRDFPADSYFNMFVEVEVLGFKLYNLTPMLVRADWIDSFPPNLLLPQVEYIHDPRVPAVPLYDENGCHVAYLRGSGHGHTVPETPRIPTADELVRGPVTFAVDADSEGLNPVIHFAPNHVFDDSDSGVPQLTLTPYVSSGKPLGIAPDMTNARVEELVGVMALEPFRQFIPGDAIGSFSFGMDGTLDPIFLIEHPGNLFFSVARGSTGSGCGNAVDVAQNLEAEGASLFASTVAPFGAYPDRANIPLPGGTKCPPNGANFLVTGPMKLGLQGGLCGGVDRQDEVTALEIDKYDQTSDLYFLTLAGDAAIWSDCNGNGIADSCDIASEFSSDNNDNGIPDDCTIETQYPADCNQNGLPDQCDLSCLAEFDGIRCDVLYPTTCGFSLDVIPADGIPDECEPDCNGNGIEDARDVINLTSDDLNGNGVPDECEHGAWIFTYDGANAAQPGIEFCDLTIYATETDLGLDPADAIDALVLSDLSSGLAPDQQIPDGVVDPWFDEVLFSLAPGSPSLFGIDGKPGEAGVDDDGQNGVDDAGETGWPGSDDGSPANIYHSAFGGALPTLHTSATELGLYSTADIDAADIGPAVSGACFDPDPEDPEFRACYEVTREQCKTAFWYYSGDDTTCPGQAAPPATGACCLPDRSCSVDTLEWCEIEGGTYKGDDSPCDPGLCTPIPTVGEWGMIVMTMLTLAAGVVVLTRRRSTPQSA